MRTLAAFAFRQRVPSFVIASLSRCGSTALYRVLSAGKVRIRYEPDFENAWESGPALEAYCRRLFAQVSGIKHVWDPNGWPFTGVHRSTMETLAESERWIEVNARLLGCAQKVVLLRRKDQLARIVSDLLGQQTDLWGHDPDAPDPAGQVARYREQMSRRKLEPLDERVIDWYVRNASPWEDRILSSVPEGQRLTVVYEDLFGAQVDLDTRLGRVREIAEWLGIRVDVYDARVQAVLRPGSKINDASSYEQIPNLRDIVARFGAF